MRRADALVMFGLTGDLGQSKLLPALYELQSTGVLDVPVIGVGRNEPEQRLADTIADAATEAGIEVDQSVIDDLAHRTTFVVGDAEDDATYRRLAAELDGCSLPAVYAALPPRFFDGLAARIAASSISSDYRLILEKPFGEDRASAAQLLAGIRAHLPDENLLVVDHFLAKDTVRQLVCLRRNNPMLAATWNADHVSRVEVTMAESFGLEGRGGFFDGVGAVRDVLQNHLLQLVATLAMELPADDRAVTWRDERCRLIAAIREIAPEESALGQYRGYTDLDDVDESSTTETAFVTTLHIDNERWQGVPWFVRSGKRQPTTVTEVALIFGDRHDRDDPSGASDTRNRIHIAIKPDPKIGIVLALADETSVLCSPTPYDDAPEPEPELRAEMSDYAHVLDAAMAGDALPFARTDSIDEAWRVVDPLLDATLARETYDRGTWGPTAIAPPGGWSSLIGGDAGSRPDE